MRTFPFCSAVVALSVWASGCGERPSADVPDEVIGSCYYQTAFSDSEQCEEYLGLDWSEGQARDWCRSHDDNRFVVAESCDRSAAKGRCVQQTTSGQVYQQILEPDDGSDCAQTERICEVFARGTFAGLNECADAVDQDYDQGEADGAFVDIELTCLQPLAGEPAGQGPDGTVCTYNNISGCTEEGRRFSDYASCDDVRSQRGYYPLDASGFETPPDDPVWDDPDFWTELAWVTTQVESCGCICCHSTETAPQGPSNWFVESGGIWTDSMFESGLAQSAGWVDSSLLGFFDAADNNGFDRDGYGFPSTDPERMQAFFEGELARRGVARTDYPLDPEPGPDFVAVVQFFEPEVCEFGEGVDKN
ncbi:MAG: proteinase inhibitor, partial [Myxococcota bacterium]